MEAAQLELRMQEMMQAITVFTKGGTSAQVEQAERILMDFQTGQDWQSNLMIYLELSKSTEQDVALVAYLQVKQILKINGKQLSANQLEQLLTLLAQQTAIITQATLPTYCEAMAHILVQLFLLNQGEFVAKTAIDAISGLSGLLREILTSGFTNLHLQIQLTLLVSLNDLLLTEKPFMDEHAKAMLAHFYESLLPQLVGVSRTFCEFLLMVLERSDQLGNDNQNHIRQNAELFFRLLKSEVKECADTKTLYGSFTEFLTKMPFLMESLYARAGCFQFLLHVLSKYFILLNSSLDYLKNSFDFLTLNLGFLLKVTGSAEVVKFTAKVGSTKSEQP